MHQVPALPWSGAPEAKHKENHFGVSRLFAPHVKSFPFAVTIAVCDPPQLTLDRRERDVPMREGIASHPRRGGAAAAHFGSQEERRAHA
jgi:hypothetical protein